LRPSHSDLPARAQDYRRGGRQKQWRLWWTKHEIIPHIVTHKAAWCPLFSAAETAAQVGVPRALTDTRRTAAKPHRLLGVGVADTIGIAAEKPAAFAHALPGPLAVVQMLRFIGKIVGLSRPEIPGPARQVERAHRPPQGGADKQPLPAGEPCPRCGEGKFVVDVEPPAGPSFDDGVTHPHPTLSTVPGRHLEGDGERVVGGPKPHLAIGVDVIPDVAGPYQRLRSGPTVGWVPLRISPRGGAGGHASRPGWPALPCPWRAVRPSNPASQSGAPDASPSPAPWRNDHVSRGLGGLKLARFETHHRIKALTIGLKSGRSRDPTVSLL
jgi:hypothetical protein